MAELRIDLQAAFRGERVTVAVDGEVVFDEPVTTDFSTGLARSLPATVAPGSHRIGVAVPEMSAVANETVAVDERLYVGVSYEDGRLTLRTQAEPFVYY